MPVFNNILAGAAGQSGGADAGYTIERSLRFNSVDGAYLNKTPSSTGNRKTWTWSCWFKRSRLSLEGFLLYSDVNGGNYRDAIRLESSDKLRLYLNGGVGASFLTDQVFRDTSGWYHLVVAVDTTQATASDRVKIYINGSQITSFSSETYPAQDYETGTFVNGKTARIGRDYSGNYLNGYLADVHFIDGQALAPTDFGEFDATTGVWNPIEFTGNHNFGATDYSSLLTVPGGFASGEGAANAFDGSTSTRAKAATADDIITFDLSSLSLTGSFEFWATNASSEYSLDGGTTWTSSVSSNWTTATNDISGVSNIKLKPSSGTTLKVTAFRNQGTVLVSGIAGVNGFHLDFSDNTSTTTVAEDSSGNNNDWTANNITANELNGKLYSQATGTATSAFSNANLIGAFPAFGSGNYLYDAELDTSVTTATFDYKYNFSGVQILVSNDGTNWTSKGTQTQAYTTISDTNPFKYVRWHISAQWGHGIDNDPATIDSLIDTPTNYTADSGNNGGNYATLNPLNTLSTTTFANGNLDVTSSGQANAVSSIVPSSGKWYFEITLGSIVTNSFIGLYGTTPLNSSYVIYGINGYGIASTGWGSPSSTVTGSGVSGDIIGLAFDVDAKTLEFYKNGSSIGTISGWTYVENWSIGFSANAAISTPWVFNFGQRPFAYTPPTGYVSLCTTNLPDPTIADGSTAFEALAYTGDGGTSRSITSLNFSPDLVWFKNRGTLNYHQLHDILRGEDKRLYTNDTAGENTYTTALTSFDDNGWTMSNGTPCNANNNSYVAWAWDAGSSNTSISAGDLNSSAYLQDAAYNSQVSGTSQSHNFGSGGERGDDNMFDGNIKHSTAALGVGNDITWSGSIPFSSSFAIASDNDGGSTAINITHGPNNTVTNVRSQVPNTTNSQIAAGTIPITTLTGITSPVTGIELVASASAANGICMVKADGKIVIDSGITPTNVPSIASTERANASAGFSIVSADSLPTTNQTFGHGLNATPHFIIAKNKAQASQWDVYHKDVGINKLLRLNSTAATSNAASGDSTYPTNPTSSVFGFRANGATNNYIFYCFSPVEGYSAFGSYTGNGSNDGPAVFTGFRPAWLLIKNITDGTSNDYWVLFDSTRSEYNLADKTLVPNLSDAEGTTTHGCDFLSNGFKLRATHTSRNASGDTYIYAAFAEHPFKTARAR